MSDGLSDGTIRHIEGELYNYRRTLQHIAERRHDLARSGGEHPLESVGGRKGLEYSDPTGFRACLLDEDQLLREMARIVRAITEAHDDLAPPVQRLMDLWYWQRRPAVECAAELHISRETAFRWKKGIVAEVARRLGWQ